MAITAVQLRVQSHLAVPEFTEPDSLLNRRNSVVAVKLHIKASVEPENKGIRIRMIPEGQLSLLPYNIILLNRISVINLEGLFLKRNKG